MSIVWFIAGILLMAAGAVCTVGAALPRDHVATGSLVVPAPRSDVWHSIRDVASVASWRPSVKAVDVVEGPRDAPTAWVEHSRQGSIRLILDREVAAAILQAHIDDKGQPFGGTWTWELSDDAGGTRVRITERGFVKPAPFRFLARFVFGHATTLRAYLQDLGAKFGGAHVLEE